MTVHPDDVAAVRHQLNRFKILKNERLVSFDPAGSEYTISWSVFEEKIGKRRDEQFDEEHEAQELATTLTVNAVIAALAEARAKRLPVGLRGLVAECRARGWFDSADAILAMFAALEAATARAEKAEQALREIAEGKGRFSVDHLQHCKNTVFDMKNLAKVALGLEPNHD